MSDPVYSDQLPALVTFGARLRRQGAGSAELRAALDAWLESLPGPAFGSDELDAIATNLALIPPRLVTPAINGLLANFSASTTQPAAGASQTPRFRSAAAIAAETPDSVDWIAEPWAAAGALTAVTGRPKIGKTTFMLDLIAAFLDRRPFLNYPASTSPFSRGERGQGVRSVAYLTEQQPSSFRVSLARSGLLNQDALAVLFWYEAMALSWPAIVELAADRCRDTGARLLVVDTLSQWAGMRGDMENQAGDAFAALQPLQHLAGEGVAVVFLQHERKSGGDAADAGRGSSAFAGAVDTLISFRSRPYHPHRGPEERFGLRLLLSLSRFEAVPPELYIERNAGSYSVVGDTRAFASLNAHSAILGALVGAKSMEDLIRDTGLPRRPIRTALKALLTDGRIARSGAGTRGSPYRYTAEDSIPSAIE